MQPPFQKNRFVDVAGLIAFPILFLWLWAGAEKDFRPHSAVLFTTIFSIIGAFYCFVPATLGAGSHSSRKKSEPDEQPGPYLLDFSIILSAPVALLLYLLYFTWQHEVLDLKALIGVVVVFPAAVGIVSWISKQRFTRARNLNLPRPPAFVPMSLLALWFVGTFIWGVFAVWLVLKLCSIV